VFVFLKREIMKLTQLYKKKGLEYIDIVMKKVYSPIYKKALVVWLHIFVKNKGVVLCHIAV
ncbi:hypothetical protein, partial [Oceanobacillus picturae]|uniref:hypothetical protein n=1 Tax=Oceanobacillus picturae TaxID=171693 RepID=UPI000AC6E0D6